mmetsp:Transcript_26986/g.23825  ORF Transcript_26986/g.23825 Transcript_26986/m.23825 type:complete len:171 (+) Transcript_26986:3-515(+)
MKWLGHYVASLLGMSEIEADLYGNLTKEEFRKEILKDGNQILKPVFQNMTDILECIGCNVCKMNAKLQFTGLGAMFKVLFPSDSDVVLTENELVGFLNLANRLSNTVKWYHGYLEYEERESFYKTIFFSVLIALAAVLFLMGALLFLNSTRKSSSNEEKMPLRNNENQLS